MNEQRIAIAGYWCKIIAVVCGLASGLAAAQETYPAKPVRIVVPFTPGTGIDILARSLGQKMGDDWKVGVVVENRPGASGNIGTEAVAKSAPDGYTLLMTASTFIMNRSLFKSIPYDPIADFAPVAPLAIGQLALVTNPSVKARTVKEFVALAKESPGAMTYGSPGNGTPHHLAMELLKATMGINLLHVPYKGTAGATQDLLYAVHKNVGLIVFILACIRLVWRWQHPVPYLPADLPTWQATAARLTHFLLYLLLFLMPLTGFLYTTLSGFPVPFLMVWDLAQYVPVNKPLGEWFKLAHLTLQWLLYATVLLHVAGALQHHLVRKDAVLRRMLSSRAPVRI